MAGVRLRVNEAVAMDRTGGILASAPDPLYRTSDARGSVEIAVRAGVPRDEDHRVTFEVAAEGYLPLTLVRNTASLPEVIRLELVRGVGRTLLVRGRDGKPAAQALVRQADGVLPLTWSDGAGRAEVLVPNEPASPPLRFEVLGAPGGGRAELWAAALEGSTTQRVDLLGSTVTGQVIGHDGEAILDAFVWAPSQGFTRSAARGTFRFDVWGPPERVRGERDAAKLFATAKGYAQGSIELPKSAPPPEPTRGAGATSMAAVDAAS